MRIGVVGAGGVGGLVAGLLARAGHDVAILARGDALAAIRARGLAIDSPLGVFSAKVEASDALRELAPVDAVLVAVKTWQVAEVAASLGPWIGPGGYVVPLENGVDACDECVTHLGEERVVGGLCRMFSFLEAPGAIKHVGPAPTATLGAWRTEVKGRIEPLVAALDEAGIATTVTPISPLLCGKNSCSSRRSEASAP